MKAKLLKLLHSQGVGTLRECRSLVRRGGVTVNNCVIHDETLVCDTESLLLTIDGKDIVYRPFVYVVLNKPQGFECSHKTTAHSSVFELFPSMLLNRGIEPAGRLDVDTTGMLIFSDDGQCIHQLTSPKWHIPKRYLVRCKHPVTTQMLSLLCSGVVLHDSLVPISAISAELYDEYSLELVIGEGKYHQVKRMLAAVGNRVESLHRSAIGGIHLDSFSLPVGEWAYCDDLLNILAMKRHRPSL